MRRFTQRALLVALSALLLAGIASAQTDLSCEDIHPPTDDLSYYVGLGNGYFAQGSYNTAIVVYTCALTVNPDFAPASAGDTPTPSRAIRARHWTTITALSTWTTICWPPTTTAACSIRSRAASGWRSTTST